MHLLISTQFLHQYFKDKDYLEITFLNVEQGDAMLIKTPNNKYGVVDGGPGDYLLYELEQAIPSRVKTLEFLIISHADNDHIQGFTHLFDRFTIKNIFIHKSAKTTPSFNLLKDFIKDKNITNIQVFDNNDFYIEDSIFIDVLWPEQTSNPYHIDDTNDSSIAFTLSYKNINLFTAGDLSKDIEESLIENILVPINILKASHHGSNTSSSEKFIKSINPEIAIISAGENNRYGHPHHEVMETLQKYTKNIYSTSKNGRIKIRIEPQGTLEINTQY